MKVDWKKKWMSIPYQDTTTFLQGRHLVDELLVHICGMIVSPLEV
jgi:hypothetical protein